MNNKTITIHWTRHAESCSNLEIGYETDKNEYPNRNIGYSQIDTQKLTIKKEPMTINNLLNPLNIFSQCGYHPNLSYIGMQQAILLGKFIKNIDYDIICVSPTLRTIMTALMALRGTNHKIYVVPFIIEDTNPLCLGNDMQNTPLSSLSLQQNVLFIKDWLEKNWIENFDDIELMDNLSALKNILVGSGNNKKEIELIDKILNYKIRTTLNDVKNLTHTLSNIQNVQAQKMVGIIKKMCDIKYIRGPDIDFTILEHFESDLYKQSFDEFFNLIIPYISNVNNIQKSNLKILCVTHGNSMANYFKNKYNISNMAHPCNTETYEEIIKCSPNFKNIYDKQFNNSIYKPIKIRTNYENFESINGNICALNGLKGVVNNNINCNCNANNELQKDVKFFCENSNKYVHDNYKNKYIKYKRKYIN
jgi:bisphosphoglycerate-dependent phosphoglycerate mutase